MTFRDDAVEQFINFFNGRKELIRNFAGCTHLELWQDHANPSTFFTYSHWISTEALDAYRHSYFFAETWHETKQLFAARPEAWSVNQLAVLV